jgi:hypothetical protein
MLVHQFYQSPAVFCPPVGAAGQPVNTPGFPPMVTGPTEEGQTLHCDKGTWTGNAPINYDYQWYRAAPLPANTIAPYIADDTPETGETIECSDGIWTGSPTGYSYQWFHWVANVDGVPTGTPISGATGSSYIPTTEGGEEPPPEGDVLTTDDGEVLTDDDGEALTI